jgi:hypothetical protein
MHTPIYDQKMTPVYDLSELQQMIAFAFMIVELLPA